MSTFLLGVAVFLFLQKDPTLTGVAVGVLTGVQTLWISPAWQQKPVSVSQPGETTNTEKTPAL